MSASSLRRARPACGAAPRRHRLRASALLIMLGAALYGCASLLPKLEAPRLSVARVKFLGGDLQQQRIQLSIHAVNPNNRELRVRGIDCSLDLGGMPFAQGATEAGFTLPALGEVDFNLDVTADVGNAVAALGGHLGHNTVEYRFYGQVRLQGVILRAIPFDQTGRVRL